MNSFVVVAVSFKENQTEAIAFEPSMSSTDILKKALETFNVPLEAICNYMLFIPAIECFVKSFEHLLGGHRLSLLENCSFENKDAQQKSAQKSLSKSSSQELNNEAHINEIRSKKEMPEDRIEGDFSYIEEEKEEEGEGEISQRNSNEFNGEDEDEINEISLEEIKDKSWKDRSGLTSFVREWAMDNDFQLILNTREQTFKKDQSKLTKLICNEKDCKFFLEFKSCKESKEQYILSKSYPTHNHKLNAKNNSLEFTPSILEKLKELRTVSDNTKAITKALNKKFNKSFSIRTVWYQLKKLKDLEFGKPTDDASTLIKLLGKDKEKRGTTFYKEINGDGKLLHFALMTNRMKAIANKFYDVIIIDASHKTNRFGMPLLDIITIDNLGKSCTIFVALLHNQKYEEFRWSLECFKANLINQPQVIFTDEEEALRKGIFW